MKVTEILPRLKDGGAFVKFQHPDGITAKEIEGLVSRYLKENPIKPWFSPFRRIRTNLVVGKPWLEDLYRFPSCRIKVEFVPTSPGGEAAELSQETLYSLFRRYGKLAESKQNILVATSSNRLAKSLVSSIFSSVRLENPTQICIPRLCQGKTCHNGKKLHAWSQSSGERRWREIRHGITSKF
jgi:hypothetical protein